MNLTDRVAKLLGEQPWPGYDEQDAGAITAKLVQADADMAKLVTRYERDHKDRADVVEAAKRRIDR